MPTVVKTIGTSSRNYSTLAAWQSSLPANLVTDGNSYEGDCYKDSEFTSASTLCTITGHTTDATHTITLTTGAGQSFRDNANAQTNALRYNASNGVGIRVTGAYVNGITINNNNVFVKGLQVAATNTSSAAAAIQGGVFTGLTIDDCILEAAGSDGVLRVSTSSLLLRNTLLVERASSQAQIFFSDAGTPGSIYFCTFVVPSDKTAASHALSSAYGTLTVKSSAFFGCTAVQTGGSTFAFTTCMTSVASPPAGVTGGKTYANQFVTTTDAARDFREKTGADLHGAGTADSTNGANDIVGTARPQSSKWDIGCWELVAAIAALLPYRRFNQTYLRR